MTIASNLGFPRIGARRQLKAALERHWDGDLPETDLLAATARLRSGHLALQQGLGISHIPSGDFSLYDHVLDTACMIVEREVKMVRHQLSLPGATLGLRAAFRADPEPAVGDVP